MSTRDLPDATRGRRGIRTASAFVSALFTLREEQRARAMDEPGPKSAMGSMLAGGADTWSASHRDLLSYTCELLERLERIWRDLDTEDRTLLTTLRTCSYAAAAEDLHITISQVHSGVKRATRRIEAHREFGALASDEA